MVGVNGGLEVDEDFYSFSIIDDEPILIFEVETGYDIVSTFSQVKKDYYIVEVGSSIPSGYLFNKGIHINDIKSMLGVDDKCLITYKDVKYYDVYNYDLIKSFGNTDDNGVKARKWLRNQVLKNTSRWMKE